MQIFPKIILAFFICSCGSGSLPNITDPPIDIPLEIPDWPGIPATLRQLPDLIEDLNLPDLSEITNLPQLEDLPFLQNPPPGAIIYNGPLERKIDKGQKIVGTDIELVAIEGDQAEFHIAGLRSFRTVGDSLDFDGKWSAMADMEYYVRLRIYRVGDAFTLKFPFTTNAGIDEKFSGMTYGYMGQDSRGGQISGLPTDEYPYRKLGDSIRWHGFIRPDLPVIYNIRLLFYNDESARIGGTVTIELPYY